MMGQKKTMTGATEERGGGMLRRMILILAAAALMAVMMVAMVAPAFAAPGAPKFANGSPSPNFHALNNPGTERAYQKTAKPAVFLFLLSEPAACANDEGNQQAH